MYWPENADVPFVPCPGSPLVIEYNSMLPFAEFVIRKMTVSSVSDCYIVVLSSFPLPFHNALTLLIPFSSPPHLLYPPKGDKSPLVSSDVIIISNNLCGVVCNTDGLMSAQLLVQEVERVWGMDQ